MWQMLMLQAAGVCRPGIKKFPDWRVTSPQNYPRKPEIKLNPILINYPAKIDLLLQDVDRLMYFLDFKRFYSFTGFNL